MDGEIEEFLKEKFVEGVDKSKVHRGKLKKLTEMLKTLFASTQVEKIRIREHLYHLNNLLDECLRLSFKCLLIIHPHNMQSYWEVGSNLKVVRLEIENKFPDILKKRQGSEASPSPTASTDPSRASADHPRTVHGFDEELVAVERLLLPRPGSNEVEKFKAVGITGVAGVGKTTLCKELLKRKGVRDHFIPRIYVQLSKDNTKEVVVKNILDSLGVEKETVDKILQDYKLEGLVCALFAQLMGKRYLIVLDNACSEDPWYEELETPLPQDPKWETRLAFGLPKGYGGTVIVTTRERNVVERMVKVKENVNRLLPLADKESTWSIFLDALGNLKEGLNPKEGVKEEILNKCAGVPLAAKMMGEIIKELLEESQKHPEEPKEQTKILRKQLFQEEST